MPTWLGTGPLWWQVLGQSGGGSHRVRLALCETLTLVRADLMNTLWEADVVVFKAHITTGPGGKVLDMFWIYDNRCELPENHRCVAKPSPVLHPAAVACGLAAHDDVSAPMWSALHV